MFPIDDMVSFDLDILLSELAETIRWRFTTLRHRLTRLIVLLIFDLLYIDFSCVWTDVEPQQKEHREGATEMREGESEIFATQ